MARGAQCVTVKEAHRRRPSLTISVNNTLTRTRGIYFGFETKFQYFSACMTPERRLFERPHRDVRAAVNNDNQADDEAQRLRMALDETLSREREAQQNCILLKQLLDALPVGLTLHDASGDLVLANAVAASNLAAGPNASKR